MRETDQNIYEIQEKDVTERKHAVFFGRFGDVPDTTCRYNIIVYLIHT